MCALLDAASMPNDIASCVAAVNAMDDNTIAERLRTLNPTVTINVGARHFLTRCLTILQDYPISVSENSLPSQPTSPATKPDSASLAARCPPHLLAVLLVGRARDTSGFFSLNQRGASPLELVIDRDGTHFRYILNYLREGPQRVVLPSDVASLQELLNEAQFYQLAGLERLIQSKLTAFSECCLQSGSTCIGRNRSKYHASNAFVDTPFVCASSHAPLIRCSSLRSAGDCAEKAELRDLEDAYRSCSIPHAVSDSKKFSFVVPTGAPDNTDDSKLQRKHRRKSFPNSRFTFVSPQAAHEAKSRPNASISPVKGHLARPSADEDAPIPLSKIQDITTPDIVEGPIMRPVRSSPTAASASVTASAAVSVLPSPAPIVPLFYSASLPPSASKSDSITFTISSPAVVTVTASPIPPPPVTQRPTAPPTPVSTAAAPSPSPSVSQMRSSTSTPSVSIRTDLPDHVAHAQASLFIPQTLSATTSQNVFTWEEISQHNTPQSCWLVVSGKVYNVTSFLAKHPATPEVILKKGGKDATQDFNFHSKIAHRSWKRLEIGKVKSDSSCVVM